MGLGMAWALAIIATVAAGVGVLLVIVRRIHLATGEHEHYRQSVRFWAGLAALGAITLVMLALPILGHAFVRTDAGLLSVGLIAILPTFVIGAGLRNAIALLRADRRRRRAMATGMPVQGRVVDRLRWTLGQDIIAVVVEADVPRPDDGHEMSYRARDPQRTERRRFVETCPGDHWARFDPGTEVTLRVDPRDPGTFALMLFD